MLFEINLLKIIIGICFNSLTKLISFDLWFMRKVNIVLSAGRSPQHNIYVYCGKFGNNLNVQ